MFLDPCWIIGEAKKSCCSKVPPFLPLACQWAGLHCPHFSISLNWPASSSLIIHSDRFLQGCPEGWSLRGCHCMWCIWTRQVYITSQSPGGVLEVWPGYGFCSSCPHWFYISCMRSVEVFWAICSWKPGSFSKKLPAGSIFHSHTGGRDHQWFVQPNFGREADFIVFPYPVKPGHWWWCFVNSGVDLCWATAILRQSWPQILEFIHFLQPLAIHMNISTAIVCTIYHNLAFLCAHLHAISPCTSYTFISEVL